MTENRFFGGQVPEISIFSVFFGQNIQSDHPRGQSLAILRPKASIWFVCAPFWIRITLKSFLLLIPLLILYIDRNVLQIFHNQNLRNLLFLRLVLQISGK